MSAFIMCCMVGSGARKQVLNRTRRRLAGEVELCPVCGEPLLEAEIDHMQPLSRQGTNFEENLWIICRDCNRAKGNMTLYEFLLERTGR